MILIVFDMKRLPGSRTNLIIVLGVQWWRVFFSYRNFFQIVGHITYNSTGLSHHYSSLVTTRAAGFWCLRKQEDSNDTEFEKEAFY